MTRPRLPRPLRPLSSSVSHLPAGDRGEAPRRREPYGWITSPALVRAGLVLVVVVLAIVVRGRAIALLPVDYDEDNYLRAGQQYRAALLTGDWREVLGQTELSEHPAFGKLIYGAVLAPMPTGAEVPARRLSDPPSNNLPQPQLSVARAAAAAFGVVAIGVLAVVDPLAGLALASSSWSVKYTSEVMLEGFGVLLSLAAVVAYLRSNRRYGEWLAASGIALGLTAATKYVYAVVGVAIAIDWLLAERDRATLRRVGAWAVLAVAMFIAANIYLWPDPVARIASSVAFHESYAFGPSVEAAGHPPWQPIVWLSQSVPWQPHVFLIRADLLIGVLAVLGLPLAWRRDRVFVLWLLVGLAFLLAWPTKWPQYTNVLTTPLAFAAASGVRQLGAIARRALSPAESSPAPGREVEAG